MIRKYTFENFNSYLYECDVDFTVNKKTAHSYYDYELDDGSKIAKVMAVFGGNGSGKSNLLKPLSFLSWFIPDSFGALEKDETIPIFPYALNGDQSTKFELEFIVPKWGENKSEFEYKYQIELTEERVVSESLKLKTSKLYSNVISRHYVEDHRKYEIKNSDKYGVNLSDIILEKAPSNCSLISYILTLLSDDDSLTDKSNGFAVLAARYFQLNKTNIAAVGRRSFSESKHIDNATSFYSRKPETFDKIKSLLMSYDLGIVDIRLEKKIVTDGITGKDIERTIPIFTHKSINGTFDLPIYLESSGTQSAFCILSIITRILETGGVAILDEFDNDLHPLLTIEIINLFKDDSINVNNAQLLFNTHTVDVLKHLRMQHCYLVEKTDGVSSAYRADDVQGLLARDNLYGKYISGALGEVPEFG